MRILDISIFVRLILLSDSTAASLQEPLIEDHLVEEAQFDTAINTWKFNYSSEAPHYFASVYGLLQQWPNTFFPNGHSIVPCEISAFTKLYHGRMDADVPPSPEWVAFDIGMSNGIMSGSRNSHMLTYQTTRSAKCIYFDGESATLFGSGQLDTQNLHIWGNLTGPERPDTRVGGLWEEYARATGLCDWVQEKGLGGSGWGVEGIVRMNAGFEMIWCDFNSPSIRLMSHLNVTSPLLPPKDDTEEIPDAKRLVVGTSLFPLPPSPTRSDKATDPSDPPKPPTMGRHDQDREPFFPSFAWNWFTSGAAHYGSSGNGPNVGETRVKLTTCGFLSYYTPEFASQAIPRSKVEQRSLNLTSNGLWLGEGKNGTREKALQALTRRRRYHSLDSIVPSEAAIMRTNSEKVLRDLLGESSSKCSGIDWSVLTNDIVQTYANPMSTLLKNLKKFDRLDKNETIFRNWMIDVRQLTHNFLLPFFEYSESNSNETESMKESDLFKITCSRCRYQHTRLLVPEEGITLGPEEISLKWAVEEVSGGICNVLINIGLSMEGLWEVKLNPNEATIIPDLKKSEKEIRRWTKGVEELMAWLGWAGEWVRCEEKCGWDEVCYIPMWPMIPMGGRGPGDRGPGGHGRRPPREGPLGDGPPDEGPPGEGHPPNRTQPRPGPGPGRGSNPWEGMETDLWEPRCINSSFFNM